MSVQLRPLVVDDAEVIAAWGDDPEFCRAAGWSATASRSERGARLRQVIQTPPVVLLRFGVVHEGELVGYVDLRGSDAQQRELGFVIGGRDRWGGGLGAAAARAACVLGFSELRLDSITAEVAVNNHASLAIVAGLGMQETGAAASMGHLRFALTRGEFGLP